MELTTFSTCIVVHIIVGLGRFGFFNFGSVFNLKYLVLVFSVSVFEHHRNARIF